MTRRLRILELALLGSGLALLAFYAGSRLHAHYASARALAGFDAAVAERTARPGTLPPDESGPLIRLASNEPPNLADADTSDWAEGRIAAYRQSLEASDVSATGVLSIPRIDLRVPVFHGTSELALNRGVGHIEGTAPLTPGAGNIGIAGHRDGFFRGLKDLAPGDLIVLETTDNSLSYRINDILIVDPEDVYVLDQTDDATLTLVTCYPFYFVGHAPRRYIVRAVGVGPR